MVYIYIIYIITFLSKLINSVNVRNGLLAKACYGYHILNFHINIIGFIFLIWLTFT